MNVVLSTVLSVSLCLGVAVAGAYAADAIDDLAKETNPHDAMGTTAMPAGTMSRAATQTGGAMAKDTMAKDAMSSHAMTRDAMTRTGAHDDAMEKDTMNKAPATR